LIACTSSDPKKAESPEQTSAAKGSAESDRNGRTTADQDLPYPPGSEVSFERELNEVARYRQLDVRGSLRGQRVKIPDLLNHVERAVDLETPEHALNGTEEMLVALGVVPLSFRYRATMLKLLSQQLAGLYEPRLQAMLIRADLEGVELRMTLLHELVHALQDQHFKLDEIVTWSKDDTDRSSALSCLAEGDATSAMFDGVLPEGQTALSLPPGFIEDKMRELELSSKDNNIPRIVQQSLLAPYLDGISFVNALRKRGGWAEVNRVWMEPPTTTEQILHLEKYDLKETGRTISVPAPPGASGWEVLLHDIWGEQNLRLVFAQWQDQKTAAKSAAGWNGDRLVVYRQGEQSAFAWQVGADTEEDAIEIFEAFTTGLDKDVDRSPAGQLATQGPFATVRCGEISHAKDGRLLAVSRKNSDVFVTSGFFNRSRAEGGSCGEALAWLKTIDAATRLNAL